MNSRGFTLVELIVVLALITILTTLGTMSWKRMAMKSAVEGQIKTVHADMMKIRLEALYGKRERRVKFNGKSFNVYSSGIETSTPLEVKNFKYPFKYATTRSAFVFNTSGMASGYEGSVCVDPFSNLAINSDAAVDSLVITDGRISLGKRTGDGCVSDDISKK